MEALSRRVMDFEKVGPLTYICEVYSENALPSITKHDGDVGAPQP